MPLEEYQQILNDIIKLQISFKTNNDKKLKIKEELKLAVDKFNSSSLELEKVKTRLKTTR